MMRMMATSYPGYNYGPLGGGSSEVLPTFLWVVLTDRDDDQGNHSFDGLGSPYAWIPYHYIQSRDDSSVRYEELDGGESLKGTLDPINLPAYEVHAAKIDTPAIAMIFRGPGDFYLFDEALATTASSSGDDSGSSSSSEDEGQEYTVNCPDGSSHTIRISGDSIIVEEVE